MNHPLPSKGRGVILLILPLLLPVLLISIGIFQKLRDDSRYGLHPFNKIIAFRNNYTWKDIYGNENTFNSGDELRGREASKLSSKGWHIGYYGLGAINTWSYGYLKYMCENLVPERSMSCHSKIDFHVNPTKKSLPEELQSFQLDYLKVAK